VFAPWTPWTWDRPSTSQYSHRWLDLSTSVKANRSFGLALGGSRPSLELLAEWIPHQCEPQFASIGLLLYWVSEDFVWGGAKVAALLTRSRYLGNLLLDCRWMMDLRGFEVYEDSKGSANLTAFLVICKDRACLRHYWVLGTWWISWYLFWVLLLWWVFDVPPLAFDDK